jgi:protein involved in polysaccharide export with SLBB domain
LLLPGCGDPALEDDGGIIEPGRPVGQPTQGSTAPSGIRPGEMIDVFVMEDESFNGSYQVRSRGDIIVPKLGRVMIGGLSVSAAESALKRELEKNQLTEATVILDRASIKGDESVAESSGATEVFLSGKVARPGRYTIAGVGGSPPTVHQAVLQAGGCSRFANKKKARILRKSSDGRLIRIDADLLAIESGQSKDIPLATGDIIDVPEKKVDFGL